MTALLALAAATLAPAHAGVVRSGPADLQAVYAPRRVAVLVGVQDYTDPALQGLRFPEKDATDLAAVLQDPEQGGFDRVLVVSGQGGTTAKALQDAIAVATADLQRDDTFLLYLSGHGTLTLDAAEGSRLWFLPSDGVLDDPEGTGLAIADLEALVADLPARRRVLMLDTCHNGRNREGGLAGRAKVNDQTAQLLSGLRGEPPAPRALREVSESEARLYAAQFHQPAMEDPNLENGVYTHYIIQALTAAAGKADLDRDGLVDVAEAHDYARDHTMHHTGGLQVPRAEYRIVGREEIYLAGDRSRRAQAEKALLSACDEILAKARLFVDGVARGPALGLTAVEPGRREIELRSADGRTLARKRVSVEAGATLPVEDLFRRHRSAVAVAAGASLRQGPGLDALHAGVGEVEVAWLDPVQTPAWLRLDAHVRLGASTGTLPDPRYGVVTGGGNALGLSAGVGLPALTLGPQLDLVHHWRTYTDQTDGSQDSQSTLSLAPGARLLYTPQVGARQLFLRADSRFVPFSMNDDRTFVWQHGFAVGLTSRR